MYTIFSNGQPPPDLPTLELGGPLPLWVGAPSEITRSFVAATDTTDRYILVRDGTAMPFSLTCNQWFLKYSGRVTAFVDQEQTWRIWEFRVDNAQSSGLGSAMLASKLEDGKATKRFRNIHHC